MVQVLHTDPEPSQHDADKQWSFWSAARNGRLNADRSTVRGGLWTGQTSRPHSFPQACGRNPPSGRCDCLIGSTTDRDRTTTTTPRRPPDTPQVAPNLACIACG